MSLRKIRRRLSQTFRFSAEDSLAALAENSSLDDGEFIKKTFFPLSRNVLMSFSVLTPRLVFRPREAGQRAGLEPEAVPVALENSRLVPAAPR